MWNPHAGARGLHLVQGRHRHAGGGGRAHTPRGGRREVRAVRGPVPEITGGLHRRGHRAHRAPAPRDVPREGDVPAAGERVQDGDQDGRRGREAEEGAHLRVPGRVPALPVPADLRAAVQRAHAHAVARRARGPDAHFIDRPDRHGLLEELPVHHGAVCL